MMNDLKTHKRVMRKEEFELMSDEEKIENALYHVSDVYTNIAQTDSQMAESYRIAIIALNKQISIKPYKTGSNVETRILCPQCNYRFYSLICGEKIAGNQSLYCPCCGQRINWDNEETDG